MRFIIIPFLSIVISSSFAQSNDSSAIDKDKVIYKIIEHMPEYEGGNKKMIKDLNSKIELDKTISGVILTAFIIDSNGKAHGFKSLKGISEEIDNKVINALKSLQNWTPAVTNGKKIECDYNLKAIIEKGKIKRN